MMDRTALRMLLLEMRLRSIFKEDESVRAQMLSGRVSEQGKTLSDTIVLKVIADLKIILSQPTILIKAYKKFSSNYSESLTSNNLYRSQENPNSWV